MANELTLYQIDMQRQPKAGDLIVRLATATVDKEVVIDTDPPGVLVPVERCVHGNIYPHDVSTLHGTTQNDVPLWYVDTCPGAGIGGDDGRS